MATRPMRIYSADDVLSIPVPPELSGYELVNGELVPMSPVGLKHGLLAGELFARLRDHVKQHRIPGRVLPEVGFVLGLQRDPERVRGPDVSFVSPETLKKASGSPVSFLRGVPELAIEVESAERPRVQQRIQDYLDAGTRLVWLLHAETNAATVYRADGSARLLREADSLDGEDVLPGLRIPLNELFADSA